MKTKLTLLLLLLATVYSAAFSQTTLNVSASSGSDAGDHSSGEPYKTISAAIAAASDGDIIAVEAGIYAENITVNKKLTVKGPNADVAGNDLSRASEAIIVPPSIDVDAAVPGGLPTPIVKFESNSEGSIFEGFEVNGDNPSLSGSGVSTDGIEVDAAFGIRVEGVGDITIQNNIVENLGSKSLSKFGYPYALGISAESTAPVSGIVIQYNYIKNMMQAVEPADLDAVMVIDNAYAQIMNNVMDSVRIGVQFENQSQPNPNSSFDAWVRNNTISSYRAGIYYNLQYGTASPWQVETNSLQAELGPSVNKIYEGIRVESIDGVPGGDIDNNIIDGNVGSLQASDASYVVRGISFKDHVAATGSFSVEGDDISEVQDGIVEMTTSAPGQLTTNLLVLFGNIHDVTRDYVRYDLASGTSGVVDINMPNTKFDDVTGGAATAAQLAAIQAKIYDHTANASIPATVNFVFPVTDMTQGTFFTTIQDAVDSAMAGDVISLSPHAYDEHVVIDKPLTIDGGDSAKAIITYTGTLPANAAPSIFTVAAKNVILKNMSLHADLTKTSSAVVTSGDATGLQVLNCHITAVTPGPDPAATGYAYGYRNAISVDPDGYSTSLGVTGISTGFSGLVFQGNRIDATGGAGFRAGIAVDNCSFTAKNNTIETINHDVIGRFCGNGPVSVTDNTFNGGGVQLSEFHSTVTGVTVEGNTFDYSPDVMPGFALLRLQNNYVNVATSVKGNTFNNNNWYISLEYYRNATIDGNTFTPVIKDPATDNTFRDITVNTKTFSSSGHTATIPIGATFVNNTFKAYGDPSADGKDIAFYNHDAAGNTLGNFVVGTAGQENTFEAGARYYIYLDNHQSTDTKNLTAAFPSYGAFPSTQAEPWQQDITAAYNKFDIGSGPELSEDMTTAERTTLRGYLFDKEDDPSVGHIFDHFAVHDLTTGLSYATIQDAVDAANTGDEIKVDAGTYAERVTVDKKLTIEGPNAGKAGDDATRVAEAIIIPPDTKISGEGTDGLQVPMVKFGSGSAGSIFDGFDVNGDNPTLGTSGVDVAGTGISVDAAFGIRVEGVGDVTIQNNIVENLGSKPISKFGYPYALGISAESTTPVSGILITRNYIKNLEQTDAVADLDAVMIIDNAYAQVTDNKMESVRIGVQFENQGMANPEASFPATVDNNDIAAYRAGIYYNLQHPGASPWIVSNNVLSSIKNPTGNAIYEAIRVESIEGAVDGMISNNTINGNVADRVAEDNSSIVTGISFKNDISTTGTFLVKGNDISKVLDGIVYKTDNTAAQLTTNVKYEGGNIYDVSRDYVRYEIAAGMTTPVADVNLPTTQLDGKTGAEYTATEVAGIESGKIIDQEDDPLYGKVNFVFPVEDVTQGSYYASIQDAVDGADPNDEIKVPAGTYAERVVVDKPLKIEGPNTGKAGDDASRVAEAKIIPPGTDFSSANPLPLVKFEAGAGGSVLDGFEVDGDNPTLPTSGVIVGGLSVDAAFGVMVETGDVTIENNLVQNFGSNESLPYAVGISVENVVTGTAMTGCVIKDNYIKNLNQPYASAVLDAITFDYNSYGQVTGNKISNVREGIQFNNNFIANPDAATFPARVDSNDISSYRSGIYYNQQLGKGSPWTVSNNTLQSMAGPSENTLYEGIRVESVEDTVSGVIEGNTIIGNAAARISENPSFTVTGISFKNNVSTTGTFTVKDNDISGVVDGIVYTAQTGKSLTTKVKYAGGNIHDVTGNYIRYETVGGAYANVDLPTTQLDGKTGREMTAGELTTAESKITDKEDNAAFGRVNLVFNVENVTRETWFATIQGAIEDAATQDGDTLQVYPGTYAERVTVDKKLTIEGPNAGKAGDNGTRTAEAVIVPPSTDFGSDKDPVPIVKFTNGSDGSVLDGLEVNGDNPALSSGVTINGTDADPDAAFGIQIQNAKDVVIENNLVENFSSPGTSSPGFPFAVAIYGSDSTGIISGIQVKDNYIKNVNQSTGTPAVLDAVVLEFNAYGQITGNRMENVWEGVQINDHTAANPEPSFHPKIDGNTILASRSGIYDNEQRASASSWLLADNHIESMAGPAGSNTFTGIRVETMDGTVSDTISKNTVIGNVTDRQQENGAFVVNGIVFKNNVSTTGALVVKDNDISGVLDGIVYTTTTTSAQLSTKIKFQGGNIHDVKRDYVRYEILSGTTEVADADLPSTELDGKTGRQYTAAQISTIESTRITDRLDDPALIGKVNLILPVENITRGTWFADIQDAIDDAETQDGDVINVDPGTYTLTTGINVTKSVTIQGNNLDLTDKPLVTGAGGTAHKALFYVTAPQVTIRNFHLQFAEQDAGTPASVTSYGILTGDNGTFNDLTIEDNVIEGTSPAYVFNSYGIFTGSESGSTSDKVTIQRNTIGHTGTGNALGRAIRTWHTYGTIGGSAADANHLKAFYASIQNGVPGGSGVMNISYNKLQGKIEMNTPAAGTQVIAHNAITSGGTADAGGETAAQRQPALIEVISSDQASAAVDISDDTLSDFQMYGIGLYASGHVSITGNVFNPLANATGFKEIYFDTKTTNSGAAAVETYQDIAMKGNTFNGSGVAGGTGIAFANSNGAAGTAPLAGAVIGGAGADANTFSASLNTYIALINETGSSDGIAPWTSSSEYYSGTAATTAFPFSSDIDATGNKFGTVDPATATDADLFALEAKINHGIDDGLTGFVTVKAKTAFPATAAQTENAFAVVPDENYTVLVKGGTDLSATTLTATKDIRLSSEDASINLQGITMNGADKTLTLGKPVTLSGALDLVKGVVATTSGNLLTLTPPATFSAPVTDAYIDGPVRKFGAGNCTFPVGKGGTSAPLKLISIEEPSVAVTVEYFNTAYTNLTHSAPLTGVSHREYWTFSTTSADLPEILLGTFDPSASGISDIFHVVCAEADPIGGGFFGLGSLPLSSTDNPLYVGGVTHSFPTVSGPVAVYTFAATGAQDFTTTSLSSIDMPNDGHYKVGDVLKFIVHFSTDVTVTGSPKLDFKLGTSPVSAEETAAAGDSIVFSYTVKGGDMDNDGVTSADITGLDPNGGTIQGGGGNADLTPKGITGGTGVRVDGIAPVISSVTIPDQAMAVGNTVTATITTVTDADTYILSSSTVGGFALSNLSKVDDTHYAATFAVKGGSTGYAGGDPIPVNITLKDAAGNEGSYTAPIIQGGDPIDTDVPGIIHVDLPPSHIYTAGETLDFKVHYTDNVMITGSPVLGLTIGTTPVTASYVNGTGSNVVGFSYTVLPGESDNDGITLNTISGLIADNAGNAADNTLGASAVGSTTGILVDATKPHVISVDVPSDKTYAAGEAMTFTVNFSEPLIVTGADALLQLTIGNTTRDAALVFNSGASVTFSYTVQAGDQDVDGIAVNALSLGSTVIADLAGNSADPTLNGVGATGGVLVDGVAPTVASVSVPADSLYKKGDVLSFAVHFSEPVKVTGTDAMLNLGIGTAVDQASFVSDAGDSAVFSYTVQPGDEDADGIVVNSLSLNSSVIADTAGNEADIALSNIGATGGVLVDGVAPKVLSVAVPADSTYKKGDVLSFAVHFSEPVTVTGTDAALNLGIGSTPQTATFVSAAGDSAVFSYTVQAGEEDADGIAVNALALNSSAIADTAGNDADVALSGVASTGGVKVDGISPTVTSVSVPGDGVYEAGDVLSFAVHFSEPVKAAGTAADLDLMIGSTPRKAAWVSVAADSIVFRYTVQAGDVDADGIDISGLSLNGSAIKDTAGNDADLTLSGSAPTGGVRVDAETPVIGGGTSFTIAENSPAGTVAGTLTAASGGSGSLTWMLADGGNPDSAFAITPAGEIIVHDSAALDYEKQQSYALVVTVTENGNVSAQQTVHVTVTDVNDAPTDITLSHAAIEENNAAGAAVGTFTTADEDGTAFTYALVSGAGDTDNGAFIVDNGQLEAGKTFDYEQQSSYSVRVRSTDEGGAYIEKVFTITITDVNEAPLLAVPDDTAACAGTDGEIPLEGISAGPEKDQMCTVSVTADKDYFDALTVDPVADGRSVIHYTLAKGASGESHIRVRVKDDGGTAEGGIDTLVRSITLTVNPTPAAGIFAGHDPVSNGDTVHLFASGGTTYSWDPAAGILGGENTATLIVRPDASTTYRVTVTDDKGCSASAQLQVTVTDDYAAIRPSNILTPNGDGRNDTWVIKNIDQYPDNEVEIFNRSGSLIWHKKGYGNDWNGTINGKPLHEGTYYYLINFGNGKKVLKGFISIVRDSEY
jgi:gliding motility-associated-like protein